MLSRVIMTHHEATKRFYAHMWPLRGTVLRTAQFMLGNSADAEDATQEAMLKAFRSIAQFDPATNAKAWLMTVLRNLVFDRHRATTRRVPEVSLDGVDIAIPAAPEHAAAATDLSPDALLEQFSDAEVVAALRSLPDDIRWALLLVDVEQLSYAHAAEVLDVPEGTVKSRLFRGRQMLRETLVRPDVPVVR